MGEDPELPADVQAKVGDVLFGVRGHVDYLHGDDLVKICGGMRPDHCAEGSAAHYLVENIQLVDVGRLYDRAYEQALLGV